MAGRVLLWGETPYLYDTATMGPWWRWVTNGAVHATNGFMGAPCLTFDTSSGFTTPGTAPIAEDPNIATIFPGDINQPVTDDYHWFMGSRFYCGAYPGASTLIYGILNVDQWVQLHLAIEDDGTLAAYRSMGPHVVGGGPSINDPIWDSSTGANPFTVPLGTHLSLGFLGAINWINGWFDVLMSEDDATPTVHRVFVGGKITATDGLPAWRGVGFGGTPDMRHSHMFLGQGVPELTDPIRKGGFLTNYLPNAADGAYQQWTPNTGTMVDAISEVPPDDDTTLIEATASGLNYSVTVDPLASTRMIYGVKTSTRYKRPASSAASIYPTVVIDDDVFPAPGIGGGVVNEWAVAQRMFRTNPKKGGAWTRSRLNSGVEWGGRS